MTTIFWAGDSTVKQNSIETYPQTGIGQAFVRFVRQGEVQVEDYAENGRSTKSFIDEGRMPVIYDRIKEGDFLFIQFGHNDEKAEDPTRYADPDVEFPTNLGKFVNVARNKKATPVFITPLARYRDEDSNVANVEQYDHVKWQESMIRTAEKLGVACIDLTTMSRELIQRMGKTAQQQYYMNLPEGVYAHFPKGQKDNSHLQPAGALAFAGLIAKALYAMGGKYAALLTDGMEQWINETENFGIADSAAQEVEL